MAFLPLLYGRFMPAAHDEKPSVLLWGGASQAKIIHQMLLDSGQARVGLIFDATRKAPDFKSDAEFISEPELLIKVLSRVTAYVVCVGSDHGYARYQISQCLKSHGLSSLSVFHPKSYVDSECEISAGCQMMPFSVLHKFSKMGEQCILNTSSCVDHGCILGKGVHIMGSAAVAGQVEIGDYATIGTNATVLPYLKIGEGAYVGAGSVVTKDVAAHTVTAGNPAKPMGKHQYQIDEATLKRMGRGTHAC